MNFLKVLVIISFIVLTIITLKLHPDMHQPMIIEDADFKLTRISDTLSTKNIPVSSSAQKPKTTEKIVETPAPDLKTIQKEIETEEPVSQPETKYINTSTPIQLQTEKRIKP